MTDEEIDTELLRYALEERRASEIIEHLQLAKRIRRVGGGGDEALAAVEKVKALTVADLVLYRSEIDFGNLHAVDMAEIKGRVKEAVPVDEVLVDVGGGKGR